MTVKRWIKALESGIYKPLETKGYVSRRVNDTYAA